MKISARNRLKDRIVDVKEGASPRERQDQGWRRNHTAAITDETVEQLKLERGKTACAVIKTSDFMVELD